MASGQQPSAPSGSRTGKGGYWLAAALVVLGLVAAGVGLFGTLSSTVGDLQTMDMPGTHTLDLEDSGRYTVFLEYSSAFGPGVGVDQLRLAVWTPSDTPVNLSPVEGNFTYALGDRTGDAVLQFEAEAAGEYTFIGGYSDGTGGPEAVLAVAPAFGSRLFAGIGLSLLIPLVIWTGAAAVAVRTYLKRKRERTAG